MEFPERYIRRGRFELHSGGVSDTFYDVNSLITDKNYFDTILDKVPKSRHYVGIATGGALIALAASREYEVEFSMVKDKELKGRVPKDDWVLIDDVVTTEGSLQDALKIISLRPKEIFVVLDRRIPIYRELNLTSLFQV